MKKRKLREMMKILMESSKVDRIEMPSDKPNVRIVSFLPFITLPCRFDSLHACMTSFLGAEPVVDTSGCAAFAVKTSDVGEAGTIELRRVTGDKCSLTIVPNYSEPDEMGLYRELLHKDYVDELAERITNRPDESTERLEAWTLNDVRQNKLVAHVQLILSVLQTEGSLPNGNWQQLAADKLLGRKGKTVLLRLEEGNGLDSLQFEVLHIGPDGQLDRSGTQPTPSAAPDALTSPTSGAGDVQGKGTSAEGKRTLEYRARLRQNLTEHFNRDELRTLCFDLGIEHENLPETKNGMARELVAYCDRTGSIPALVAKCKELRPGVSWDDVPDAARKVW